LVSEDDWIVADSSLSLIDKPIDVIDDQEFTDSNIITGVLETSKGTYFLRRLNQSNMRLIAFLPHSDISRSVSNTTLSFSIILLLALIITTTLTHIFAKRLMYPIEQLKDTMKASEISENLILLDVETSDEINTLIQGYNRLAEHVNQQNEELMTLSSDLIASEKELQNQYTKVSELAYSDYLTGLPNRVKFEEQAKLYIGNKEPFAMFYVDLDNFKYINDTYGHNYGDVVLQIISKRVKDCCRGVHFAARLSGDEFGILIMNNEVAEIQVLANKLLALINEPIYYKELEFIVTGSLGISNYPDDGHYFEDILSNADIAMYEAKSKGSNNYLIFCQDLRDDMIDRVMLESQLFNALDNNELYLCYQPLIDFKTKTINGFEALARWNNGHLGFVPPTVFIPIAEKNLTITPIGYFVLEEAIKVGVELHEKYGKYYEMNVNVSVIQLHPESFVDDVLLLLEKYNYPPEYLNLEITESIALETNQNIQSKLETFRNKGISLSLDDFGSGYSSLNHLLNVDLTHLKIDRLIIMEASKDPMVFKLIHGIVEFAHAIGLKVVAEGIEDVHMEMLMQKMTIDFAQGYLYSKPVKKSEIAHIISQKF
jgi:diguanylate cyclase (GGDEF)-like protein